MICTKCKARFGPHYKKCPSCGSDQIKQEQRASLQYKELELTPKSEPEPISALVEFTELDDFGTN